MGYCGPSSTPMMEYSTALVTRSCTVQMTISRMMQPMVLTQSARACPGRMQLMSFSNAH
jgi:hypothetical protein